jgi:hypothetical protein
MAKAVRIYLDGFLDTRRQFQELPQHVAVQAQKHATRLAEEAVSAIGAAYATRTGDLAAGLKVVQVPHPWTAAVARVVNTVYYAKWYEQGTQARHTKWGANRGSMPAKPTLIPIMIRMRRQFYEDVAAMLEGFGFTVRGRAA